jgi:hypothetical protein
MGRNFNRFAAILLLGMVIPGLVACLERPAPVVVDGFESLRPLRVAVLPAVFLPHQKGQTIHKSRDYTKYFYHPSTKDNPVLKEFEKKVRKNFQQRTIEVVDPQLVEKAVFEMNPKRGLSWKKLGESLKVDTLVFITLYDWKPVVGTSKASRRILRVDAEVALYHVVKEELLWRDRNYPGSFDYTGMSKNQVSAQVVEKAVQSIFQTFPKNPAS